MGGVLHKIKIGARRGAMATLAVVVAALAADRLAPPPLERAEAVSPLVTDYEGRWLHGFTTPQGRWRFRAEIETIDPQFIERLIAVEDKRYYRHWGVDPYAAARAGAQAIGRGEIVSGASTITMQTARLLEPRKRTLGAKLIEMARAVQLERRLTKDEILEIYLTLAPYGGNIEGVRAASLAYFGKEPARLTDAEQALLIALPQAPEARRPDLRAKNARAARADVLAKLTDAGVISAGRAREANEARVPARRLAFPRRAWHASRRLAFGGDKRTGAAVRATIDARLQGEAEALAAAYADKQTDGGIAAILIVDVETMAVRAAVGSSGVAYDGGWNDLTRARRSPGSTLKPFVYGLAFDDGLAGPETLIDDKARLFGGDYAPENFDRTFRGEVRIREALQHSLNVPAVAALDQIGAVRFSSLMGLAGVDLHTVKRADDRPGLTLALGGASVTLSDIALMYAGLANDGVMRPLRWRADDRNGDDVAALSFMSAASAARINEILRSAPAPEGRAPSALTGKAPRIAFKTGTSYGFRDAWAAGHAGGYAVAVWTGRADGAPRTGQTGRKAAAPLLFDVFDRLDEARMTDGPGARGDGDDINGGGAPGLVRFSPGAGAAPPEIVFPRDGVEIFAGGEGRQITLAARGGAADYRWYIDGAPLARDAVSGRAVWRPRQSGFYEIVLVDAKGRAARSKVRVHYSGV